mgnify:CR=1 FL=1
MLNLFFFFACELCEIVLRPEKEKIQFGRSRFFVFGCELRGTILKPEKKENLPVKLPENVSFKKPIGSSF